jgi:uncharacterized protein (UPF0335 family)
MSEVALLERPSDEALLDQTLEVAQEQLKTLKKERRARKREAEVTSGTSVTITDEQPNAVKEIIKPAATNKQLIAFIERVENVELELAERSEDRKQIYAEARSCGFDVPTMKKIVALRKMDEADRLQAEALLATYMHGVGMAVQTEMKF